MKKNFLNKLAALVLALILVLSLAACTETESSGSSREAGQNAAQNGTQAASQNGSGNGAANGNETETRGASADNSGAGSTEVSDADRALDAADLFTKRDLEQTADLSEAVAYAVSDGSDLRITAAGVYVLTGSAKNVTLYVEAGDEDKVQLVLDGLTVTNDDFPVIYVKNADKVFLTTAEGSENSLAVTGTFRADGTTNTDAVIFSRDDLVFNGLGSLTISSSDNGVACKDGIKVTGGVLSVTAADCALEVKDFFAMYNGDVTLTAKNDGVHAEDDDDDSVGWVYLGGGSLNVTAGDDGIHATTIVQIDGGAVTVSAAEGIEGTWIQFNDGEVTVSASDDGVNAAAKSRSYAVQVEINGGTLTVSMGHGDTDGIDSNGSLLITGGTVSVTAQSAFDWDGTLTWTGGTVYVNGTQVTEITNQFGGMGGFGGQGGWGGGPGGRR